MFVCALALVSRTGASLLHACPHGAVATSRAVGVGHVAQGWTVVRHQRV